MTPIDGLRQAWRWSVRRTLHRWVRATVKPDDAAASITAAQRPVCYVLERESRTDLAVLQTVCRELHLPSPQRRLRLDGRRGGEAHLELSARGRAFRGRAAARAPRYLEQLVAAVHREPTFDVDLVPVAVFWGRAPHKELSWWRLLFTEDWVVVGGFKKLLHVIFNGRNTLVHFGDPMSLRGIMEDASSAPRSVRRVLRTLRASLRAQRASTIGPDLSHRRTLVAQILRTQAVRQAVRREMIARRDQKKPLTRRAGLLLARRHAVEIAANYSQPFITLMSLVLGRLWNWLYDGVDFEHAEKLNEAGDGSELIYVPCHRSHMDYLLLSYVIYHKGFAVPHVAAGANLNMPVIGRLLRKGGAFFLRRSFKGDPLYAVVFMKYLGFMMSRGHPLEYFIEGGRSRTGRMLAPRTGMLSMTVRSFVRQPQRRVIFMPVYFGYERIAEGRTYLGELSGRPKRKESVFGLVKAVASVLRSQFGRVHVNLGEPIALDELLQRHNPQWRETADAEPPPSGWMSAAIEELARLILVRINAAAAVTPVNLVAMVLLATPRQALPEGTLIRQIDLYQRLLRAAPYAPLVTATREDARGIVGSVERMRLLVRQPHPLGDILRMTEDQAVLATYYRNNILHLFALPSLIACGFISNARLSRADLGRLCGRVYPYIAAELFLRWHESEVPAAIDAVLDAFAALELLHANAARTEWQRPAPTSPQALSLSLLAQATIQTLERYYLVVALLLKAGSGGINQSALEESCHLMAQRMSVLYGLNSPEFFDKSLFRNFIDLLRGRGVIERAANGQLLFGEALMSVATDAQLVLSEQIRHSILQVTLGQ